MVYGCFKCGSDDVIGTALISGIANINLNQDLDVIDLPDDELQSIDFEVNKDSLRYATCNQCNATFKLPRLEVV